MYCNRRDIDLTTDHGCSGLAETAIGVCQPCLDVFRTDGDVVMVDAGQFDCPVLLSTDGRTFILRVSYAVQALDLDCSHILSKALKDNRLALLTLGYVYLHEL